MGGRECSSSLWPTTTAQDVGSGRSKYTGGAMHPGTTLNDAVNTWPTARAEDSESTGAHRGAADTLTSATQEWPTPKAQSHAGMRGNDLRHGRVLDEDAANWRTPNMRDHHPQGPRADHPQRQLYLSDQTSQWRTPSADHKDKGASQPPEKRPAGGHTLDLQDQAEFWPTPAARDWKSGEALQEYGNARPLNEAALEFWGTPRVGMERLQEVYYDRGKHNVEEQAGAFMENWPTPRKSDTQADRPLTMSSTGTIVRQGNSDTFGANLADIAAAFSSPPAPPIPDGLSFYGRVRILLPLCRRLRCSLPSPYRKVRSMFRRKLNPNFVDWLMGQPVGWSSAGLVFNSEEMESYLCNARRFLENSPRD
jgi:hypothetical protein